MIYCCKVCRFLFTRVHPAEECPVCEQSLLREANAEEQEKFRLDNNLNLELGTPLEITDGYVSL